MQLIAAFGQDAIQLSAKLIGLLFHVDKHCYANTPQTIQIQNPTQVMHQLVDDFDGKQVATRGDIASGSSGHLSFTTNQI